MVFVRSNNPDPAQRKKRLLAIFLLAVLVGLYALWDQRPRLRVHYDTRGKAPVSLQLREGEQVTGQGSLSPGQRQEFALPFFSSGTPISLEARNDADQRIARFSMRAGREVVDVYIGEDMNMSTQPRPAGMVEVAP